MNSRLLMVLICVLIAGCAGSWKPVGQGSLDKNMLNKALNKCDFEKQRKLSHLYYAGSHGDDAVVNERMKKAGDKVYQDALLCMKNEGFTK